MDQPPNTPPPRSCLQTGLRVLLNGTGLLLILFSLPTLYFNETGLIDTAQGLGQASQHVISVPPNAIDPQNEGKLVHVAGLLEVGAPLTDPLFGISLPALKLTRELEMFQWVEITQVEKRTSGGVTNNYTHYQYQKDFVNRLVDDRKFNKPQGHENPRTMPGQDEPKWVRTAPEAKLGAFTVRPEQFKKVAGDNLLYQVNANPPQNVPPPVFAERQQTGQLMTGDEPGWMYFGSDLKAPQLGDIRVRYRFVPPREVTIVAAQKGDGFAPYLEKSGTKVDVLRNGIATAQDALQEETMVNHFGGWFLRFVLGLLLAGGLALSVTIWRRVPGVSSVTFAGWPLFALLGSAGLSSLVIGLGWLLARPLTGLGLLILGAVLLVFLYRLGVAKKAALR